MIFYILLALFLLLLTVHLLVQPAYVLRIIQRQLRKVPPGPKSLPFVGATGISPTEPWKTLTDWGRKYGGQLYTLYMGPKFTVVLCGKEAIKSAMNNAAFDGRPDSVHGRVMNGYGLTFVDGPFQKTQRRFCTAALKNLGAAAGRLELNPALVKMSQALISDFRATNGQPFISRPLFDKAVVAAMCNLVQQGAMTADHPKYPRMIECLRDIFAVSLNTDWVSIMPTLRFIPPFKQTYEKVEKAYKDLLELTDENLSRRMTEDDRSAPPKDFLDAYARHVEEENVNQTSSFTKKQMAAVAMEFLMAGAEDIIVMLRWLMLLMVHHPDVMRKCQKAIDEVVEPGTPVSLEQRPELGYIDAVVLEATRYSNLAPYPLPRRVMEDVEVCGYTIPKDTTVMTNAYSVHFNEEYWGDPEVFRPERFIDETGKFVPSQLVLAFGTGRRVCPGSDYAKMMMFVFFAGILQHFDIVGPPNGKVPHIREVVYGLALFPPPFEIRALARRRKSAAA